MNTTMNSIRGLALLLTILATVVIGCGGTGSPSPSPAPTGSPGVSPGPTITPAPSPTTGALTVTSPAQAAALVFASDPRWASMIPMRPDLIGASMWYEASATVDGFIVAITAGSGDCQAGCIDQHTWTYHIDPDGTVTLTGDEGDEVEVSPPQPGEGNAQVTIQLTAGPTCPVVQDPPDPNCDARAVENAAVVIYDTQGAQVAVAASDDEGFINIEVPAGAYFVVPNAVQGLMGTPEPQAFAVVGGDSAGLLFSYDTGIR